MVYIYLHYCKSLFHKWGEGLKGGGRRGKPYRTVFMLSIGLVFAFYVWERDLLSEYLQYWPHDV